jgi:hypothetical protein
MSLINEALKQASRSQKIAVAGAASGAAGGLRPVEEPAPARKGSPSFLLPALLVVVMVGAGWFLWQWWKVRGTGQPFRPGAQLAGVVNSVKSLTGVKPETAPEAVTQSAAAAASSSSAASAPAGEPAKPSGNAITRLFNKTPAAPNGPVGFPKLKLQGVYYRAGDSTALINGKNVVEGDEIEGASVVKIDRQSVEVQFQGESRVLRIH